MFTTVRDGILYNVITLSFYFIFLKMIFTYVFLPSQLAMMKINELERSARVIRKFPPPGDIFFLLR